MKDIVFITFDIPRTDYPAMTYSMASIFATLQANGIGCSHYPIDIKQSLQDGYSGESLIPIIREKLAAGVAYFRSFRYVAISVSRWSVDHCHSLLELLSGYSGKIILGGYEITAADNDVLLSEFPKADFFVKGYAERVLVKLLKGELTSDSKILYETISEIDLASPYLTGVLNLYTRKIYWETKRGCRFRCGFCEWGNADKFLIELDKTRLHKEIELIKQSSVEEINILDATFNFGRDYLGILEKLLVETDLKITFQARFETIQGNIGERFLDLSAKYKDRIHMEFGLQTIHQNEMDVIGRRNDLSKIATVLERLNVLGISYEVSIIYAIPGQTTETFIDTIEFLLVNGCHTIRAYPLQIPRNSELEKMRKAYQIVELSDKYNTRSVESSISFRKENRVDMDKIAGRLSNDALIMNDCLPLSGASLRQKTPFQYEILSLDELANIDELYALVDGFYVLQTMADIFEADVVQSRMALGEKFQEWQEGKMTKRRFLNNVLSKQKFYHLRRDDSAPNIIEIGENRIELRKSNKDVTYYCNIRLGKSGNFYVYRDVIYKT